MILLQSCNHKESLFEKSLTFPENATLEENIDLASRVTPILKQLEWQKLEMTAFIHFGINTFTNREWGDGKESPSLFDPVEFDAFQWVRVLQDAGLKMLIITAKHHDGFCLRPTSTTEHSVAASPWRDGKGDLVKEVKQACDSLGMKFGVYVSPWDMNAPSYGDSPKYNDMFNQQLTELLSNYG
ncbi:MAG: alpha-L-fucosidase [Bacteroidales bacterium]|jgi:alpha-L-fucosidase|nr:alpha-L-fucosidase [Bacteroidales bacterium]